ncbi:hypothetical protein HYPSUDRAFT_41165 [Hypholoma sublateritium FD-334 SS-4]|uniref:Uncharacterized protein n=1 Tax=Hypholoma sublateritium (strain FD-334 SS-4) TaxID=945553 RepID=A0A0D2MFC2_HYPSF|nr:hypothetical protein HYPSUDRAFT_41165 [Hypholoma sublateritium FD-334 SS-4]
MGTSAGYLGLCACGSNGRCYAGHSRPNIDTARLSQRCTKHAGRRRTSPTSNRPPTGIIVARPSQPSMSSQSSARPRSAHRALDPLTQAATQLDLMGNSAACSASGRCSLGYTVRIVPACVRACMNLRYNIAAHSENTGCSGQDNRSHPVWSLYMR